MKLATAIMVASCRVSSAMPFEMPEKAAATRPAASRITTQPSTPPFVAPSARPTSRMISACNIAVTADCRTRAAISAERRTGVARKRSTTPRSRSSIVPMPAQVPEKNAVITAIPGVR